MLGSSNMQICKIILLLLVAICSCSDTKNPLVQTPLGTVRGTTKKSYQGRDFAAFEGIPYAKPPTGKRRFESPEPIDPWYGTWDAVHSFACAQTNMTHPNFTNGDEDCLYINVYVPHAHLHPDANLDVVVHIHGGAFMYGSGNYFTHADILMDTDSVFVTFNYRLGVLGFLSTEDDVVPGNNGMKDQVMALKWVQKNIASFGGNPNSVTLTGLSAGGSSVHLHYLSEMSKGLFHRGFAQSGVALNTFALQKEPLAKAKIFAQANGCPISSTKVMVECLKQRPFKYLLNPMGLFFGFKVLPLAPFAPVVEKSVDAFLDRHPYEVLVTKSVLDVPLIFSNTADEGYVHHMLFGGSVGGVNENWETLAPIILDFNYTLDPSRWVSTAAKVKEFYFGEQEINDDNILMFSRMFGDRIFYVDIEKAVRVHAKAVDSPIYYYYFSYPGENMKFVPHGSDGRYFFSSVSGPMSLSKGELEMAKVLVKMLTSFARTGIPVIDGVDWKPVPDDKLTYLNISGFGREDVVLTTVDDLAPLKFWKSLNLRENENLVEL